MSDTVVFRIARYFPAECLPEVLRDCPQHGEVTVDFCLKCLKPNTCRAPLHPNDPIDIYKAFLDLKKKSEWRDWIGYWIRRLTNLPGDIHTGEWLSMMKEIAEAVEKGTSIDLTKKLKVKHAWIIVGYGPSIPRLEADVTGLFLWPETLFTGKLETRVANVTERTA